VEPDAETAIELGPTVQEPGRAPHFDHIELVAVFAGAVGGAIARGALGRTLETAPDHWPTATLIVNLLAALALGFFAARLRQHPAPNPRHRAFLGAGVCGTLSTFSTLMLELLRMIDAGDAWLALGYGSTSIAGGLLAVALGGRLAGRVRVPA
jgi:CrcB protein